MLVPYSQIKMDCQVHAIEKAIRPIFADPVTYTVNVASTPLSNLLIKEILYNNIPPTLTISSRPSLSETK